MTQATVTHVPSSSAGDHLRGDLLTRECPPEVYGGAGVHVEYLARELRPHPDVRVRCFGGPRGEGGVTACSDPPGLSEANAAVRTLGVDLEIAAGCAGADVVHCHTWCPTLARHVAKLLHGVPHVVTTHSLEPLRRWKAELGGGYPLSSRDERTAIEAADAVVAVSTGMRRDVLDPDRFTADLAAAITQLRDTPDQAAAMGIAGRRRAVEHFSWSGIADRTVQLYRSVAGVQAPADVSGAPTSNHP